MNIHRIVTAGKTLFLPAFLMAAGLLIAPDVFADGLPALTTKTMANGSQQWLPGL